ncbi:Hypothetical predicted protein, partial [Mytilus galloprovincialis]
MKKTINLLVLSIIITVANGNLASSCRYKKNIQHKLIAHCENQGFTSVPRKLRRDIYELILSNNSIHMLTNNSFINYSKMERLILTGNNISVIHEDAFVGLDSLKVLK